MLLGNEKETSLIKRKINNPWAITFIIAFFTALSFILPYMILDNGLFLFYGDFCVQQVPFYSLAHDAIRSGNIWWNWNTDLGANFIGSYAFYLLGSPFFWLTMPLPSAAVPYTIGPLLALKIAVAALTAYAYLSRFTKKKDYAVLGALLYAFSSYSIYDIFFNHFHEPMAMFPLLLLGMEEMLTNNRKFIFAITVFINALVNYNFFVGEVFFVIIYFIVRAVSGEWELNFKKFLNLAFEAILGFALSAFLVLPAVLAITGNPRTSNLLTGWNLLVYNWPQRYLDIIHSVFFPQDLPSAPNFFPDSNAKWSSIAAWLPMFSMSGVIAYLIEKKGSWLRRIIIICFACALIPGLNALFVLFNDAYYARWYYMGVLMLTLATVKAFENPKMDCRKGFFYTVFITIAFIMAIGLIPQFDTSNKLISIGLEKDIPRFLAYVLIVALGLLILGFVMSNYRQGSRKFARMAIIGLVITSSVYGNIFIATGKGYGWDGKWFKETAIDGAKNINYDRSTFTRMDVLNGIDNQGMFFKIPTINAFQSVVPASIMDFYNTIGVTRDVGSRPNTSFEALRPLLSVKYLFDQSNAETTHMPGWNKVGTQLGFTQWENKNFIPMGFTYDKYMTRSDFNGSSKKDFALINAILLDDEQEKTYANLFEHYYASGDRDFSEQKLSVESSYRRQNTCSEFSYDNDGFKAKIDLPKENLVFFSVPYDDGWKAYVNGKPAKIEKVNVGFMAVDCKPGTSDIRFVYRTPGLYSGIAITCGSVFVFVLYYIFEKKRKKKKSEEITDDCNISENKEE